MGIRNVISCTCDYCGKVNHEHTQTDRFLLENKGWYIFYIPFYSKVLCSDCNPKFKLTSMEVEPYIPFQCRDCEYCDTLVMATRFRRTRRPLHYPFCVHNGDRAYHNKRCKDHKKEGCA